jgi:hypothetical protein
MIHPAIVITDLSALNPGGPSQREICKQYAARLLHTNKHSIGIIHYCWSIQAKIKSSGRIYNEIV